MLKDKNVVINDRVAEVLLRINRAYFRSDEQSVFDYDFVYACLMLS